LYIINNLEMSRACSTNYSWPHSTILYKLRSSSLKIITERCRSRTFINSMLWLFTSIFTYLSIYSVYGFIFAWNPLSPINSNTWTPVDFIYVKKIRKPFAENTGSKWSYVSWVYACQLLLTPCWIKVLKVFWQIHFVEHHLKFFMRCCCR
jgi:hypothetical protein